MGADWYYMHKGSVVGPVSPAELTELARQGVITPETRLREGESGAWFLAIDAGKLFDGFEAFWNPALRARPDPSRPPLPATRSGIRAPREPEEILLYERPVTVTSKRLRVGRITYAINAVKAVELRKSVTEKQPALRGAMFEGCLGVIGLLFLVLGMSIAAGFTMAGSLPAGAVLVLIGALLLIIVAEGQPPRPRTKSSYIYRYQVVITTATGDFTVLTARDPETARRLVRAIEQAISERWL